MSARQPFLGSPDWWRAWSLWARVPAPTSLTAEELQYGRLRRDCWDSGLLSGGRDIPLARWETVGVDPDTLLHLLAEPASSLADRLPRPEWLNTLRVAWDRFGPTAEEPWSTAAPLVTPIRPLLSWARAELISRLHAIGPITAEEAKHAAFRPPVQRLAAMMTPTLALEINVAREQGELPTDVPDDGFAAFIARLAEPGHAWNLLREYPVLAEQLVIATRNWLNTRTEFVRRFIQDLPRLNEVFGIGASGLRDLKEVRFDAGDSHLGGRTVVLLTFTDGRKLVYKPRSVRTEAQYNALLDELSPHLTHPLKTLRVLERDGYGWVEFAEPAHCTSREEVERFFWRQGAYLALFYALSGSDLHHENVLACGEHPVIVDVEALFSATPRMFGLSDAEPLSSAAVKAARDSVLRVGLLPDHVIRSGDRGAYGTDISGLSGGNGQLSLVPVTVVQHHGTDRMHLTRERRPMPSSSNQAQLGDGAVDVSDYRAQLIDGFQTCYRLLRRRADQLLGDDGALDAFRDAPVRTLLRPTASYAKLLGESWHPDVVRDSLDREYLFESLSVAMHGVDEAEQIVASEIRQLAQQDIPFFHTTADSVDLADDEGVLIRDFFERSGLDTVRDRLARLSESDLVRQTWLIEASVTGMRVGEFHPARQAPVALPERGLDEPTAIRAAELVGKRLLELALDDESSPTPSWLAIAFTGDRFWKIAPTGADLYGGLAGIGLFFAELDAAAPGGVFREPAVRIARHLGELTDYLVEQQLLVPTLGSGGMTGIAGIAYTFFELGRLWDRRDLIERARALALDCARACRESRECDLLTGVAGTALTYAGIHRSHPDERTLEAVTAAGKALVNQVVEAEDGSAAWPADMETREPLLGMSHGSSGIALALAAVADVTGDERCAELVVGALRHERGRLSRSRGNWPDLRSFVPPQTYRDTWCHGAAGVGLARAELARYECVRASADASRLVHDDLRIAVDAVRRDLFGEDDTGQVTAYVGLGNDSLCHGDPGLLATLRAAAPVLERTDTGEDLAELAAHGGRAVADRVCAGDLRCGTPDGLVTPGLMVGLAGIGYGLLRLGLPDQAPDVLSLAPAP